MLKTIGGLVLLAIFANLASTGALNPLGNALAGLIQPVGLTFSGMVEGASKNSDKIEAIVCRDQGKDCAVEKVSQE